jgi:predicted Zn-dependent protease
MKKSSPFVIALFVMLPALVQAKTYPHGEAKVSITIPDKWKVEVEEDTLSAKAPDETVFLAFMVLAAHDMDEALKALDQELSKVVKDVTAGDAKEVTIHGMKGAVVEGKGKVEGQKVDLGVLILKTKAGKVLLGVGVGATGMYEKHEKEVDQIFDSITAL